MIFDPRGVVTRVDRAVGPLWPRKSARWAQKAAEAFAAQLLECRAATMAAIMDPIARHRGLTQDEIETLGTAVELLQVGFDFADNLADADADRAAGRSFTEAYRGIPVPVRPCMPAMLVATALTRIVDRFPAPRFTVTYALRRLTTVLSSMMTGQDEDGDERGRIARIAGDQGLLLCLPWWLTADWGDDGQQAVQQIERWSVCLGCVWEYTQRVREDPRWLAAWRESALRLQCAWPRFDPFVGDGDLAIHRVMPSAIS